MGGDIGDASPLEGVRQGCGDNRRSGNAPRPSSVVDADVPPSTQHHLAQKGFHTQKFRILRVENTEVFREKKTYGRLGGKTGHKKFPLGGRHGEWMEALTDGFRCRTLGGNSPRNGVGDQCPKRLYMN